MTKKVSCWTHIILEGYCFRTLSDKKHKYNYQIIDRENFKTKKVLNTRYDPNYRTPRKPRYCPEKPQYLCLNKKCPHLAYCDAEKEDYLFLNKKYKKKRKN
jgi:hypothetical protein